MEMDGIYQEILSTSLWEPELGFPELALNTGLLGKDDGGLLLEGESFWGNEDFPLKEALLDSWGPSLDIDEKSIRDDNPFAEWLDERVDLTEFDQFISSPEFDSVMHDLDGTAIDLLSSMESFSEVKQVSASDNLSAKAEEIHPESGNDMVMEEVVVPVLEEEASSSKSAPSFFVEVYTTSPLGSPGNELIGQPQQTIDVVVIEEDATLEGSVDIQDSSSNLGSPADFSSSSKSPSLRKGRTSQRRIRSKPYSRTSSSNNSDTGDSESCSSFEGLGTRTPKGPKERKRVQNRCAANRYRLKKRSEQSELDKEEEELAAKNKELSQKADQLFTEIGYLKGLMREMLISKGLLKKD